MNDLDISDLTPAEEAALARVVRDALSDEGAAFVPLPLAADLFWRETHIEQRHSRALGWVAATVALLALASSLAWTWQSTAVPTDVPRGGALPEVVHLPESYEVPELLASDDARRAGERSGLAVGKVSYATALTPGVVVVVLAETGRHLFLEVPANAAMSTAAPVALSPDGLSLAWSHASTEGSSAGVAVLDLTDGNLLIQPSVGPADERALPTEIVWSPDSTKLAWRAMTWNALAGQRDDPWIGLGDARSVPRHAGTTVAPVRTSEMAAALVLSNDALAMLVSEDGTSVWVPSDEAHPRRRGTLTHTEVSSRGGATASRDGATLMLASEFDPDSMETSPDAVGYTQSLALESGTVERVMWSAGFPTPLESVSILGTTPAGATVVGSLGQRGRVELRARSKDGDVRLLTTLTTFNSEWVGSVATDLGDVDPVAFPVPGWARERPVWVAPALIALGVATAGAVLLARRRERRTIDLVGDVREAASPSAPGPAAMPAWSAGRLHLLLVLACAAALLWTALPLLPRSVTTAPGEGALPTSTAQPAAKFVEADDLDQAYGIGRLSLVAEGDESTFLAVSAKDGRHRILPTAGDHPTLWTSDDVNTRQAISPDGSVLATAWADVTSPEASSGIALIDLATGLATPVPLTGANGRPVVVSMIAWSHEGTHVAWFGNEANSMSDEGVNLLGEARTVGVMPAADPADVHWRVAKGIDPAAVATDDDGNAYLLIGRSLHSFSLASPDEPLVKRTVSATPLDWSGASVTADGRAIDVGLGGMQAGATSTGVRRINLVDGSMHALELPGVSNAHVEVLGHSPEGSPVVARRTLDSGRQGTDVLVASGDGARLLTEVSFVHGNGISVATALTGGDSVDFGDPRWPVTGVRVAWTAALSVLLAVLVVLGIRRFRAARGTRTAPQEPGSEVL